MRRILARATLASAALSLLAGAGALAQSWPTHPVNVVVPFTAGTTSGANVALADVNHDNRFDIRVTPGAGKSSQIYNFNFHGNPLGRTAAFGAFLGGTFIAGARF